MRKSGMAWLPVLALVFNACTWGVSWWPYRELQTLGLHPLWATTVVNAVALVAVALSRPSAWVTVWRHPALWWLVLASGATNATFNWAMTLGDVVRVVLLFYLMPLWAVLLARVLLGERFTVLAWLRVALALAGAAIVLWPQDGSGLPLPRTLAEGLAVLGGLAFALNNVMLRREAASGPAAGALAMFLGGTVVSAALALLLAVPAPAAAVVDWLPGALLLALVFLAANLALQFGATRLPANATAVIMISEVVFASVSSVWMGASTPGWPMLAGGTLIVGASLLAARQAH
jgi:drug/metabolite transporter (DMT)-like permease